MAEDRPLELAELRARLDPELVAELRMGAAIRLECVGLALRAVQSEHQLPPDLLAVGMPGDQRRELRDECNVVTERKPGLVSELFGDEPQLREPLPLGADEPDEREAGERFPAPELEREVDGGLRASIVAGCECGPAFGEPPLEDERVDLVRVGSKEIARPARDDPVGAEETAEVVDVDLERRLRAVRRVVFPERVDGRLAGDDVVCVQDEQRQQEPLLGCAEVAGVAFDPCLEGPEHAKDDLVVTAGIGRQIGPPSSSRRFRIGSESRMPVALRSRSSSTSNKWALSAS